MRNIGKHGHLHDSHDFACLRADHRKAKNVIVAGVDQRLHESARFTNRARAQHHGHGHFRDIKRNPSARRFDFGEADVRNLRVREQTRGDDPVPCGAISASEIVANDSEIVQGDMGELRTTGAFANGPNIWRGGF